MVFIKDGYFRLGTFPGAGVPAVFYKSFNRSDAFHYTRTIYVLSSVYINIIED
jgi:hypothetical protein